MTTRNTPDPRLDDLQRRIDERRRELDDLAPDQMPASRRGDGPTDADDEPRFLDTGEVETDTVDNAIAPPG